MPPTYLGERVEEIQVPTSPDQASPRYSATVIASGGTDRPGWTQPRKPESSGPPPDQAPLNHGIEVLMDVEGTPHVTALRALGRPCVGDGALPHLAKETRAARANVITAKRPAGCPAPCSTNWSTSDLTPGPSSRSGAKVSAWRHPRKRRSLKWRKPRRFKDQ